MTERDEKSEGTLAEGMKYMLDNEIATDVRIVVGPPDGDVVTFRAHKFILMSRSEVFEGMFTSGMLECSGRESNIRVEDIDADIFKELLNYMYCDSASICSESAAYLLYAAKKYMLTNLVRECCSCLVKSVRLKNVIHLLEQSLLLDEPTLQSACLELISENATTLLTGTEILSAPRLVMEAIFKADTIPVRESVLYETAVNWAKYQLQSENPDEIVTGLEIRETLGDLLYNIRFPLMKPTEFAEISNGLLTAEEKASVYNFLLDNKKDSKLKFSIVRRRGEELCINRAVECMIPYPRWTSELYVDAITFTTDQDVLLTGIGLYSAYAGDGYDVNVEIVQSVNSLFKKSVKVPNTGNSTPCKISLENPIVVTAGVDYTVKALALGRIGYSARFPCREVCVKETVTFKFSSYRGSRYTDEFSGQIPRLYFCIL